MLPCGAMLTGTRGSKSQASALSSTVTWVMMMSGLELKTLTV